MISPWNCRHLKGFIESIMVKSSGVHIKVATAPHKLIAIHEESRSAVKNRPVFDESFQLVLNDQKIDGLIIAKLDRMGRSVKDLANLGGQLQEAKKQLVSVHDNIDTSTANGRLLFNMLAAIAEYERELLLERTKEGRKRAQKEGKLMHRPRYLLIWMS